MCSVDATAPITAQAPSSTRSRELRALARIVDRLEAEADAAERDGCEPADFDAPEPLPFTHDAERCPWCRAKDALADYFGALLEDADHDLAVYRRRVGKMPRRFLGPEERRARDALAAHRVPADANRRRRAEAEAMLYRLQREHEIIRDMLAERKATLQAEQLAHWREHDPLRWRAAVAGIEYEAARTWLANCEALGMPADEERAKCDRLRDEHCALLHEAGRRETAWQQAKQRGRVKRVREFEKTGRTVLIDGVRVPVMRRQK